MNILERLGLKPSPPPLLSPVSEIIDAPRPSIRADTLRFAGLMRGGFTDDALVGFLARSDVARTTLLTPRVKLLREGLIVKAGTSTNERGNLVALYKSVAFMPGPAKEPPKRLTRDQLQRKLTTANLELSVVKGQRDALIAALDPDKTKAAYIGEFRFNHEFKHQDGTDDFMDVTLPWTVIKDVMKAIAARAGVTVKQKD